MASPPPTSHPRRRHPCYQLPSLLRGRAAACDMRWAPLAAGLSLAAPLVGGVAWAHVPRFDPDFQSAGFTSDVFTQNLLPKGGIDTVTGASSLPVVGEAKIEALGTGVKMLSITVGPKPASADVVRSPAAYVDAPDVPTCPPDPAAPPRHPSQ
eukprot:gene3853-4238_t